MSKEDEISDLPEELLEELEEEQRLQRGLSFNQWQNELKLLSTMGRKTFERSTVLRQVTRTKQKQEHPFELSRKNTKANSTNSTNNVDAHLLFLQHPDILIAESRALASSALQRSEMILISIRASMSYSRLQYIKRYEAEALIHDAQLVHLARELLQSTINLLTLWMQEQKDEELCEESHSINVISNYGKSNNIIDVEGKTIRKNFEKITFDYVTHIASLKELCEKYMQQEINDYFTAAKSWMSEAKENRQIRFACAKDNDNNDSLFDAIMATLLGCGLLVKEYRSNNNNIKKSDERLYKYRDSKHEDVEEKENVHEHEYKQKKESLLTLPLVYVETIYDHLMWLSHQLSMYFGEYDMARNYAELAALVLTCSFEQKNFTFVNEENWRSRRETNNESESQTTHAARREGMKAMQESVSNVLENSSNIKDNISGNASVRLIEPKYMSRYLSAMQIACELAVRDNEYSKVIIYIECQINALNYLNTNLIGCSYCNECDEKKNESKQNINSDNNDNRRHITLHFSNEAELTHEEKVKAFSEEEHKHKEHECRCCGNFESAAIIEKNKSGTTVSLKKEKEQYSQYICSAHVAFWTSHTSTFIKLHVMLIVMLLYTLATSETHTQQLQRLAKENVNTNDRNNSQCDKQSSCETSLFHAKISSSTGATAAKETIELSSKKSEKDSCHNDDDNNDDANISTINERCMYNKVNVQDIIKSCLAALERCQHIISVIESCFHLVSSNTISSSTSASPEIIGNGKQQEEELPRARKLQTWPFVFKNSTGNSTSAYDKELADTQTIKSEKRKNESVRATVTKTAATKTTSWAKEWHEWKQTMLLQNKEILERHMHQQTHYYKRQQRINAKLSSYAQYARTQPLLATSMLLQDVIRIVKTIADSIVSINTYEEAKQSTSYNESESAKKDMSAERNLLESANELHNSTKSDTSTHTLFSQLKILLRALHCSDHALILLIDRLESELHHLTKPQNAREQSHNSLECVTREQV